MGEGKEDCIRNEGLRLLNDCAEKLEAMAEKHNTAFERMLKRERIYKIIERVSGRDLRKNKTIRFRRYECWLNIA